MVRTQKTRKKMKTVDTLNYSKKCPIDRRLISTVNTYCGLEENEGIPPTSLIRNFLTVQLKKAIDTLNNKNQH